MRHYRPIVALYFYLAIRCFRNRPDSTLRLQYNRLAKLMERKNNLHVDVLDNHSPRLPHSFDNVGILDTCFTQSRLNADPRITNWRPRQHLSTT